MGGLTACTYPVPLHTTAHMKYLFAFKDATMCRSFRRALEAEDIVCEVRAAHEFPDGTQGPELWVRDEDHDRAARLVTELQSER